MAKTLTLDEMRACIEMLAKDGKLPKDMGRDFGKRLEFIGDEMAGKIAEALGVDIGKTRAEEPEFAGTCCVFYAKDESQVCPYPLTMYDATEWETEDGDEAPIPEETGGPVLNFAAPESIE